MLTILLSALLLTTFLPALAQPTASNSAGQVLQGQQPTLVSFPSPDGGTVFGNLYGKGDRGLVLAHGGRFNKESWAPQAPVFAQAGFHVLAIDFRGYGKSTGPGAGEPLSAPLYLDVLAAVRYLRKSGAKTVAVVGGSMGAGAGADATILGDPGEIERIVELGGVAGNVSPEKMTVPKLFIVTRDDTSGSGPRLPDQLKAYAATPQPKQLIILEGSAHAQFMFQSDLNERVMREILTFLNARFPPRNK